MGGKSWKDELLSSSLPLEHDTKRYLEQKGCIASVEFSYIRPNEQRVPKQFSYDIDASYISPPFFADVLVECKYRSPGVRWVFTPQEYGGPEEVSVPGGSGLSP
jgi:hypothetical protein